MKNLNQSLLKILTFVSLVFLAIPLSIYGLWISVSDTGATPTESTAIFNSYFPEFLQGRWDITILSILLGLAAFILSAFCLKLSRKTWRILNFTILIISSLLLLLNVFSMM